MHKTKTSSTDRRLDRVDFMVKVLRVVRIGGFCRILGPMMIVGATFVPIPVSSHSEKGDFNGTLEIFNDEGLVGIQKAIGTDAQATQADFTRFCSSFRVKGV